MGVQVVLMGHELLFVGSHSQLLSHQASNSSRCSSSVIENSSSRPSWLSSFSVMTTSSQGVVEHSMLVGAPSAGLKLPLCVGNPTERLMRPLRSSSASVFLRATFSLFVKERLNLL